MADRCRFFRTDAARYDRAFRSIVGKRYDEIEQEIWMEVAETAITLAKNLSLPVGTAQDLAETMRTVMVILFGPEFRSETLRSRRTVR